MSLWSRVTNAFGSGRLERDLDDELRFHVEERTRALIDEGMPPEDAAREARRRVGNRLHLREQSRDVRVMPWLDSLVRDLRLAIRRMRKDAIVNGAAIASLALALGACLTALSLVDALILRPLTVRQPDQLIYLAQPRPDGLVSDRSNYPLFARQRDAARDRVDLFLVSTQVVRPAVFEGADGRKEQIRTQYVSADTFERLGVSAASGRVLVADDDAQPGASPVAVLSHAYWMGRFGGDPGVIGRRFALEGTPLQIVGVAEPRFSGVEPGRPTDVWLPAMMYSARAFEDPNFNWFRTFGRVKGDAGHEQAAAALQAASAAFRREYAERFGSRQPTDAMTRFLNTPVEVRSAANGPSPLRDEFGPSLWLLAATAVLILVIAGSNVANLLLARTASREREMSLRLSIGAARARLIQQVLIESALMAALACALGLLLTQAAAPAIVGMLASAGDPLSLDLRVDWRVAASAAGLTLLVTVLAGVVPALRASGTTPMTVLRTSDRRAGTRIAAMRPFVVLQVAFSLVVLFVGGLLVLSFVRLSTSNPGFDASNVLLLSLEAEDGAAPADRRAALLHALDRVAALPGIQAVGSAENNVLGRTWTMTVRVPETEQDTLEVTLAPVTAGFIETMRIPLVAGRAFAATDMIQRDTPPLVVSETFARQYFGAVHVVGRRIEGPFAGNRRSEGEIVGVVADTKYDLRETAAPTVYFPIRQHPGTVHVRAAGDVGAVALRVRDAVHEASALLRVTNVTPLSASVGQTLVHERLLALLASLFAGVGLVLAAVGLYGVLSHSVVQRTREIGVRMALGARPSGIVGTVLADASVTILCGIILGLAGGFYLSRFVESLLFKVTAFDLWSLALPLGALLVAATMAAVFPAWRAARVAPVVALRHE